MFGERRLPHAPAAPHPASVVDAALPYAVPIRADVRKAERLDEGDRVQLDLTTGDPR